MGMAGAVTAATNDTTANFYNPAALTTSTTIQIDTGYMLTSTTLTLNDKDVGVDEGSGLQVGIKIPGKIGPVRLAFGLGLHLPQERLSRVRALPQYQPRWVMYDNRPQRLFLNVNLAISPLPWLHIGGGINFLTHTRGSVDLTGLLFVDDVERSTLPTSIDVTFSTFRYPSVGLLIAPNDNWSIGLCYREEVAVELDLGATVDGAIVLGGALLPGHFGLRSYNHNLFTPRQLWLGTTWRPLSSMLLSADLGWLNWSAFPSPTANVTLELAIENFPTEGLLPPPTDVIEPNFSDIFSVRVGLEQTVNLAAMITMDFRMGYAFEPSPAPDQPAGTNYVDTSKHTIAAGLGVSFADWSPWVAQPLSIDVGAQLIVLPKRQYLKSDPTDLIGDYTASGTLVTGSVTARWQF